MISQLSLASAAGKHHRAIEYAVELATQMAGLTCLRPIRARVGDRLFYSWLERVHYLGTFQLSGLESDVSLSMLPRYGAGWLMGRGSEDDGSYRRCCRRQNCVSKIISYKP